mmetsp:Transcript_10776/g.40313  ORF Transcript_10776/g.40313 Transcript_10776/m.40313 type:complete len:261 (+) Transcript_10776:473-1255(+)
MLVACSQEVQLEASVVDLLRFQIVGQLRIRVNFWKILHLLNVLQNDVVQVSHLLRGTCLLVRASCLIRHLSQNVLHQQFVSLHNAHEIIVVEICVEEARLLHVVLSTVGGIFAYILLQDSHTITVREQKLLIKSQLLIGVLLILQIFLQRLSLEDAHSHTLILNCNLSVQKCNGLHGGRLLCALLLENLLQFVIEHVSSTSLSQQILNYSQLSGIITRFPRQFVLRVLKQIGNFRGTFCISGTCLHGTNCCQLLIHLVCL